MSIHRFPSRQACVALALPAAMLALPMQAAAFTLYDGPVDPPPRSCTYSETFIPDGPPRARPVLQLTTVAGAASAQVVPQPDFQPRTRLVAYSYAFSRLDKKIPTHVSGVVLPSAVRVVVYAGSTTAARVVSDQQRTGTNAISYAIAYSATTLDQPASIRSGYANQWLVKVTSTGAWQSDWYLPWRTAAITMDCVVTVQPATAPPPPPMVLQ